MLSQGAALRIAFGACMKAAFNKAFCLSPLHPLLKTQFNIIIQNVPEA